MRKFQYSPGSCSLPGVSVEGSLFPNKNPFGEYHPVGILSDSHYISMEAISESILYDSLCLSQDYFQTIVQKKSRSQASGQPPALKHMMPV